MKEWIVPAVIGVVWLLNAILRSRDNDEPVRPARPAGDRPNAGRGPTGDIDRFLQEIERMRRKSADERGESERPKPVPRVRPVPQVVAVPRARPVVRPVRTTEPPPVLVVEAPRAVAALPQPAAVQPTTRVTRFMDASRRSTPGTGMALNLLKSPQSLAAAVVLQEVLGPPKCRRR